MDKMLRRADDPEIETSSYVEAHHRQETSRCIRDGIIAMCMAMLVLLVFNSGGLRAWARNLPGNAVSDRLVGYTDTWHAMMRAIGTTLPKETVQSAVAEFRDYDWAEATGMEATARPRERGEPSG